MSLHEKLEKLEKEREKQVTRVFWMGLEIAVLFAVPLAVAVIIAKIFGGYVTWIALVVALIISWSLMIRLYRRVSRRMQGLDTEIKSLRQELNIEPRPEHKYPDEIQDELEK